MEIKKFLELYSNCKHSMIYTGYSDGVGSLKVAVNHERTHFTISIKPIEKVCRCCGTDLTKNENNNLKIEFYEPEKSLTIFQAYLLWLMFKMKKIPIDYGRYHECVAGKEFIDKYYGGEIGDWCAVKPCGEQYKGKTFLGILLGELPVTCGCSYDKEKALEFYLHMNPAIYVPEIKEIIFGCGSWWHKLDKPEDLKQITKKDINDVWYVKALKELAKEKKENRNGKM